MIKKITIYVIKCNNYMNYGSPDESIAFYESKIDANDACEEHQRTKGWSESFYVSEEELIKKEKPIKKKEKPILTIGLGIGGIYD